MCPSLILDPLPHVFHCPLWSTLLLPAASEASTIVYGVVNLNHKYCCMFAQWKWTLPNFRSLLSLRALAHSYYLLCPRALSQTRQGCFLKPAMLSFLCPLGLKGLSIRMLKSEKFLSLSLGLSHCHFFLSMVCSSNVKSLITLQKLSVTAGSTSL